MNPLDDGARFPTYQPVQTARKFRMTVFPRPPERISERLLALTADSRVERITVADMVGALGDRGFGLLLLLLTLPNAVPVPGPGLSAILALPAAALAAQMAFGLAQPWLPQRLHRWSFSRLRVAAVLAYARPSLERLESWVRPRRPVAGDRLVGVICMLLALVLALPITLGNAPVAWALIVIAVGVIERDGLATVLGMIAGGLAVAWNILLVVAGHEAFTLIAAWTDAW